MQGRMEALRKRARNKESRKFETEMQPIMKEDASCSKRHQGKPRSTNPKPMPKLKVFERSITISVGGSNVDTFMMANINKFLTQESLPGKCSLEREVPHFTCTCKW